MLNDIHAFSPRRSTKPPMAMRTLIAIFHYISIFDATDVPEAHRLSSARPRRPPTQSFDADFWNGLEGSASQL